MEQKISKDKANFIKDYIKKIENCFSNCEDNTNFNNYENDILDILTETINVFKNELPDLENSVWFRSGTAERDANIIIASLKKSSFIFPTHTILIILPQPLFFLFD